MHPLHDYLSQQLAQHLSRRRVATWYDPRKEFEAFVNEVRGGTRPAKCEIENVRLHDFDLSLCEYRGSFLEVRNAAEEMVSVEHPAPLLVYVPGVNRDRKTSVLMELENAGHTYEPQLKRIARRVLLELGATDGVIDGMLAPETLEYGDIVSLIADVGGDAGVLKLVMPEAHSNEAMAAAWLASPGIDRRMQEKDAVQELRALLENRLGFPVDGEMSLEELRIDVTRFVLVGEFRIDLEVEAPSALSMISEAETREQREFLRRVAETLRGDHADAYVAIADAVEKDLSFATLGIDPERLGRIDTFRFEETMLLDHVGRLIVEEEWDTTASVISQRYRSFWADRDPERQGQWEACRLMAALGQTVRRVRGEIGGVTADPEKWVSRYTEFGGWYEADLLQRSLEALVARVGLAPNLEAAMERVRRLYDQLGRDMASQFAEALSDAGWTVPGVLHQTRVYPECVAVAGGPVAYILVDAMRFEMGIELHDRLADAKDLSIRPAVAALPSITPVGMAALLPEASATFDVVESKGKLAVEIEGTVLKCLKDRVKLFQAKVPGAVDLDLGKLLQMRSSALKKKIEGTPLVVVRSQEIDAIGESTSTLLARQVMDTAIGNVARAVRCLANAGVEYFVIASDHGHLFALERGDDMKTDNPKGDTVELHRRCWAGRGGATPTGSVRVSAAELGYRSDLEFVFPSGLGVFKAGGDLAYHHGGASLQELIVPVLTFRMPVSGEAEAAQLSLVLGEVPDGITNRTFAITLRIEGQADLFGPDEVVVRPLLLADGEQVGEAGMAVEADFDRVAKTVRVAAGKTASVVMLLTRDDCKKARLVIQDVATSAVLAESDDLSVRLGI